MGYITHDMLVGADTGWQHFRNIVVGNGRETPVNSAGSVGIPLIADRSECHDKGKCPVLVIDQVFSEVARLNTTEGQGHTAGKADGEYRRGIAGTKRYKPCIPADLYIVINQLFRHADTIGVVVQEDVEIFFLQLKGNLARHLFVRRGTHNGGKTRGCTVNKLNTTHTENPVIGSAEPDVLIRGILCLGIEIGLIEVADDFIHLFGKKGGHAGVQCRSQVRKPEIICN